MTYTVRIANKAAKYVGRLDRPTRDRIEVRLGELEKDPYSHRTKPLINAAGKRSSRVGDYRIIYTIDEALHVVEVSQVLPRGRAYREL